MGFITVTRNVIAIDQQYTMLATVLWKKLRRAVRSWGSSYNVEEGVNT